jgi:hypothetical protein
VPSVAIVGPYRLFFYSSDRVEPPHVHVERERLRAKIWLDPVRVEWSNRFGARELRRIERIVAERSDELLEAWNAFFAP